ncbi:SRPBCC family protein [Streptomyces angustmyceticus]
MAVRHQLINRAPEVVWTVPADGTRYADRAVGTDESRTDQGTWPQMGSTIAYTVRLGPWTLHGHTTVRRCDPPRELELEVESGSLGTTRIAIDVRPWGENSLVIVDEHPLTGPVGVLHNVALDALLQLRHRSMLSRLSTVIEGLPRDLGDTH